MALLHSQTRHHVIKQVIFMPDHLNVHTVNLVLVRTLE